ncbi:Uncharacterized protein HZ326_14310 [Fusarium oxysporum f. sp. albedinis]|nr:Uncharacterized protein HZ326_14310 [Fusarium oxysporum f. sp. albedinis]
MGMCNSLSVLLTKGLCHDRARGCHSTSIFFVSCNLQITTLPCPILSCRGVELGSFVQVFPYPVGSRKTYNAAPNLTSVRRNRAF